MIVNYPQFTEEETEVPQGEVFFFFRGEVLIGQIARLSEVPPSSHCPPHHPSVLAGKF